MFNLLLLQESSWTMCDALKKSGSTACSERAGRSLGIRNWMRRQMVFPPGSVGVRSEDEGGGASLVLLQPLLLLQLAEEFMVFVVVCVVAPRIVFDCRFLP